MNTRYIFDETNHCPGCGRTHWIIGRVTAECAFCGSALPLADYHCRRPRVVGFGNGGGKISRGMVAA
jgi:hypothetical protein